MNGVTLVVFTPSRASQSKTSIFGADSGVVETLLALRWPAVVRRRTIIEILRRPALALYRPAFARRRLAVAGRVARAVAGHGGDSQADELVARNWPEEAEKRGGH